MKKKDILNEAIKALRNEPIPQGPSKEKIEQVIKELPTGSVELSVKTTGRIRLVRFAKIAAVVILLITTGYIAGQIWPAQELKADQIRTLEASLKSSLEPTIRRSILKELSSQLELSLVDNYSRLRDDLSQQWRQDLSESANQILKASGMMTNQLLIELIKNINAMQAHDRQQVAAALKLMELNHLEDMANFVIATEDELNSTKQDVAALIAYSKPNISTQDKNDNSINLDERSKK